MIYKIKYYAGPYNGTRTVTAEDGDEAIEKVKRMIRREMTLTMYSDGYTIEEVQPEFEDEY